MSSLFARNRNSGTSLAAGPPPLAPGSRGSVTLPPPSSSAATTRIGSSTASTTGGIAENVAKRVAKVGQKFEYDWENLSGRFGQFIMNSQDEADETYIFKIPNLLPTDWYTYNIHVSDEEGLYKINLPQIKATRDALNNTKELTTLRGFAIPAEGESAAHFTAILSAVAPGSFTSSKPDYFYFPTLKIKCNGKFILNSNFEVLSIFESTVEITPKNVVNPNVIASILNETTGSRSPTNKEYLYQAVIYVAEGGCGIIDVKYIYMHPDEDSSIYKADSKTNADKRYKESLIILNVPADDKKFSRNLNLITYRSGEKVSDFTKPNDLGLFENISQISEIDGALEILNENNCLRNELEVLYFFNDDKTNYKMSRLEAEKIQNEQQKKLKENFTKTGSSFFTRMNNQISSLLSGAPRVNTAIAKEAVNPQSSNVATGRQAFNASSFVNAARPPAGRSGGYKKTPMFVSSNPFFKRTNVIGKLFTNMRKKARKNRPSRIRKTKRKSMKRRNKKSTRRQ